MYSTFQVTSTMDVYMYMQWEYYCVGTTVCGVSYWYSSFTQRFHCIVLYSVQYCIQWNLQIKDTLGTTILSLVGRLSDVLVPYCWKYGKVSFVERLSLLRSYLYLMYLFTLYHPFKPSRVIETIIDPSRVHDHNIIIINKGFCN